jgi:hypothetical protein
MILMRRGTAAGPPDFAQILLALHLLVTLQEYIFPISNVFP